MEAIGWNSSPYLRPLQTSLVTLQRHKPASSATALAVKTRICSNVIDYIRKQFKHKQILHLIMCHVIFGKDLVSKENSSWLNQATQKYKKLCTHFSIYQLPQLLYYQSHHPHLLLQLSLPLQITLQATLCKNLQATTLPTATSTGKLQILFKEMCHICYGTSIFLNLLTYVKLCYHVYQVSIFFLISHLGSF